MAYTKLGRIRPAYRGAWSADADYEVLEIVGSDDGRTLYIAQKAVPAGTALSNGEYWEILMDVRGAMETAENAAALAARKADALKVIDSGNPVEFWPDEGSVVEFVVAFGPVQAGEGDPSPDNIRPLSVRTSVPVSLNGGVKNIALGRAVCGGTVDTGEGVIVQNETIRAFDGTENWSKASSAANTYYLDFYNSGGSAGSPSLLDSVCSHYKKAATTALASSDRTYYPLSYTSAILRHAFTDSGIGDLAAWKAYLAAQYAAGTPVQVSEILPEAETFACAAASFPTVSGANTAQGDVRGLSVRYSKSLTRAIGELKNAILSLGGNV